MRNVAIAFVALTAAAHAGPLAAVKKRGFTHASLVAKGKVSLVVAQDADGNGHTLLVDGRGRVADAGEGGSARGTGTVKVSPFFGQKALLDVDVAWSWSSGMGGGSGDTHYIVRAKKFTSACSFDGSASQGLEDVSSSTTVDIAKTGDAPLTWTLTLHESRSHAVNDVGGGGDRVITYTLGASGACEMQQ